MNIEAIFLNTILAIHAKVNTSHDQFGFWPGKQSWCNIRKSISVLYHIKIIMEKNTMVF